MGSLITCLVLGIGLMILGVLNFLGHIESIHWYNRKKITEATRIPYGRAVGTGTAVCGLSIAIASVLDFFGIGEWVWILPAVGCVIGLIFILYGQFKYNKGIF